MASIVDYARWDMQRLRRREPEIIAVRIAENAILPITKKDLDRRPEWADKIIPGYFAEPEVEDPDLLQEIFPGKVYPLFAEWYSGRFRFGKDRMEPSAFFNDYIDRFRYEVILEVVQGVVVSTSLKENTPYPEL